MLLKFKSRTNASAVAGLSGMALFLLAFPAQADLVNGSFSDTGSLTSSFQLASGAGPNSGVTGWSFDGDIGCLVFSSTATTDSCGPSVSNLWAAPTLPGGGNFIAIDGDRSYGGTLSQTLTVTAGQSYTVSFLEGAAQFRNLSGATMEQWLVSFDTPGLCDATLDQNTSNCESQYTPGTNNIDGTASVNPIDDPSQSDMGWFNETVTFTAQNTTTEVLSFFAVGTPVGVPPTVLLADVSLTTAPEPGAWVLLGSVVLGVGIARRKRNKHA
jgi:hypothetical protein